MKSKAYNTSLLIGTSIIALSMLTLPIHTKAHVSTANPHISIPPTCHTTNSNGSAVLSSNPDESFCPTSTRNNYMTACEPTPTTTPPSNTDGCCFIAGTKVLMADGTTKNIEEVNVGDQVLGGNNTVNTVKDFTVVKLNDRPLISINGSRHFATSDHVFKSKNGWVSADPQLTETNYPDVIEHIGTTPNILEIGTILLTDAGEKTVQNLNLKDHDPNTEVYDISLTGNKTFYADHFLVHNAHGGAVCFFAGTKILMADGTTKNIEIIEVGDLTAGGLVHQKFARHYDHALQAARQNGCMQYDGIYVTGFHVVLDGQEWIASYDSQNATPSNPPNNAEQAYNLVTEERIIPVIGASGLHYFSDELNNIGRISEKSLSNYIESTQETA